ncbi:Murein tripeptide amidase MpaA [Rhizobiales bacterium GAS113]|nr:Murein tripeptide amidase MpaA [Rhizobiales bacterium GAS113]
MSVSVNATIPGGRIEVVDMSDPGNIELRLMKDSGAEFRGYYHFRASGVRGLDCTFRILNAGDTLATRLAGRENVENAWTNTGPAVSYDRSNWFRLRGRFDGQVFSFSHRPDYDLCYYASFAPYGMDRQLDLLARLQLSPLVRISTIGRSVLGADIDCLTIGTPAPDRLKLWVIARQHPSETQGGFFLEGFLERMIDEHDPIARQILQRAVLYVVPNMNPDGTMNGWARANALGVNLNREWVSPSAERSPEVLCVRDLMERIGVDFCIDCHADSELRCNFLGGPLEIPSRSPRLKRLFHGFEDLWAAASPDYERGHPYPGGAPENADMTMAWNWIAERFDCLSILLEQPFKDTSWWQDEAQGWSPQRATRFGASLPTALHGILPHLR